MYHRAALTPQPPFPPLRPRWAPYLAGPPPLHPPQPGPQPPTTGASNATEQPTGSGAAPWSSAPPRPRQSSWTPLTDDGRPAPALPSKAFPAPALGEPSPRIGPTPRAAHTAVDVDGLEEISKQMSGGEDGDGQEAALQMARVVGAEKLYVAFHDRYTDGHAPLEDLQALFEAADLFVTEKEIDPAVVGLCPEALLDHRMSYHHCQEVYLQVKVDHQRTQQQTQEMNNAGRLTRWISGLSDTEATNVLLVVVVVLCSLSAFLAAGIAIALMVTDSMSNFDSNMQADLAIMGDSLEVFARQLAPNETDSRAELFLTTLASIAQLLVYGGTIDTTTRMLVKTGNSVSASLEAWWNMQQDQSFMAYANLTALFANVSVAKYGLTGTRSVVDEVNNSPQLPSGYEVMLGQRNVSTGGVDFLTAFRYGNQCPTSGCLVDGAAATLMLAALSGRSGAQSAVDYRNVSVYAGYSSLNNLGVEVKVDVNTLLVSRYSQIRSYFQSWNSAATNGWEFILVYDPGARTVLTTLPNCSSDCTAATLADGTPAALALAGKTGTMTYTNGRGVPAIAAYYKLNVGSLPIGLVIQTPMSQIVSQTLSSFTAVVDTLNSQYASGSQEFELATFQLQGGNTTFTHLTAYRYASECPNGQCVLATDYLQLAAQNCSEDGGVARTTDYRGQSVVAGYTCVPELNLILVFKVDTGDVETETLQAVIDAVNTHNAEDNSSSEFVVATPNPGLTAAQVKGYGDFKVRSHVKYPNQCVNVNCTWNRTSALRALEDLRDVIEARDYRNVAVKTAPMRSTATTAGIGLAMERDRSDAWTPVINTIIKISSFAAGMVVFSTVVLVAVTKVFLRSMITAKEEGRRAVETEKNRFSKLVASMYPKYVVPRLLAEEKQMVCEVPRAAVFFSDIHEFTSASNTMGSKELLLLLGYVYGVMDDIADYFGVYKVKTIGDAYLAVLGLPGSDCENPCLDLLRFASCVCQVFGNRFVHPAEGQVLAQMNKTMMWNGRAGAAKRRAPAAAGTRLASHAPSRRSGGEGSETHRTMSNTSSLQTDTTAGDSKVQCIMSYGLAVGKLVAGVLAGRCPMFDIWGGTVNLASRMQSTGEPGRIQVSESLYKRVTAVPGQPFSFEDPRSTFCKGFGNVNAYMVRTTTEGLPKDLQLQLKLEPRYGAFYFDNILTQASGKDADAAKAAGSPTHGPDSPQPAASPRHTSPPKPPMMSPRPHRHASPKQRVLIPNPSTSPRNRAMTPKQRLASAIKGAVTTPSRIVRGAPSGDADLSETEVLVTPSAR
eukprot:EG_transcript_479